MYIIENFSKNVYKIIIWGYAVNCVRKRENENKVMNLQGFGIISLLYSDSHSYLYS